MTTDWSLKMSAVVEKGSEKKKLPLTWDTLIFVTTASNFANHSSSLIFAKVFDKLIEFIDQVSIACGFCFVTVVKVLMYLINQIVR